MLCSFIPCLQQQPLTILRHLSNHQVRGVKTEAEDDQTQVYHQTDSHIQRICLGGWFTKIMQCGAIAVECGASSGTTTPFPPRHYEDIVFHVLTNSFFSRETGSLLLVRNRTTLKLRIIMTNRTTKTLSCKLWTSTHLVAVERGIDKHSG